MADFVGRAAELRLLAQAFDSRRSELIPIVTGASSSAPAGDA